MLRESVTCSSNRRIGHLRGKGCGNPVMLTATLVAVMLLARTYSPGQSQSTIQRMVDSVSMDNLRSHVLALEQAGGHGSRVNFTPGNDSAASYLSRAFMAIPGVTSVSCDTFYVASATGGLSTKPLVNVEATLRGVGTSSAVFVIGGHYDCSGSRMGSIWTSQWQALAAPGADDNATGAAAVLEIARILSDPIYGFEPDITVRFVAFGAEESGPAYTGSHLGSMHFVDDAKASGTVLSGMVSIDMVGYNPSHLYQSVITNSASVWLANLFASATIYTPGLVVSTTNDAGATYSDHNSFWLGGIPAVCLMEHAPPWTSNSYYQANPFYHTSWDTSGTVNFDLVRSVTQLSLAAVATYVGRAAGVSDGPSRVTPASFVLEGNFPNPFNPTTVISYQVSVVSSVRLVIYDVLGRKVRTLVDEVKMPGRYEVPFDARLSQPDNVVQAGVWKRWKLASGVYFCQMEAHGGGTQFRATRKMLLTQ